MKKIPFFVLLVMQLVIGHTLTAQVSSDLWKESQNISVQLLEDEVLYLPDHYRLYELNQSAVTTTLSPIAANLSENTTGQWSHLNVPLPDGKMEAFKIKSFGVLHPDLAEKFPQIMAFSGYSIDNSSVEIYISYTPLGFHATIVEPGESTIIIEPVSRKANDHCLVYYAKDAHPLAGNANCAASSSPQLKETLLEQARSASDCQLRTYRAAIATTSAFTATFIDPVLDPTGVIGTLSSINALLVGVNSVFINDFAIQLQLVPNNDLIIFIGADLYTDGDQSAMAGDGENQMIIDNIIGTDNYDIGHAIGLRANSGGSGVSQHIGNVCVNGNKANAASVINPPNPFGYRGLFMHEFGHQFGANHTFNEASAGNCGNAGQLSSSTSYEPGSGSTIMSYGGTCASANVQSGSNSYFHTISLLEVGNYVTAGAGGTCPILNAISNNQPTVSAANVANYNIPIGTPFMLTATANDPDGDLLTYSWEQFDRDLISHPPASTAVNGPVFRSFVPTASPTRFFPRLDSILLGVSPAWEVLPTVARVMNFQVTVRDNAFGGGCTDEDQVQLTTFADAGPFRVLSPIGNNACFAAEGDMEVNWDVAGTDGGSVNCGNVDILLSIDGGFTYPFDLALNTANDGSQVVSLPDIEAEFARIMVKCSDNVFFNISAGNFQIDCESVSLITDNPAEGVYQARERVETVGNVTVLPGSSAAFYAGEEVLLTPGFHARFGSRFIARIQTCAGCAFDAPAPRPLTYINPIINTSRLTLNDGINEPINPGSASHDFNARIYPNPSSDDFKVMLTLTDPEIVQIHIFNVSGQAIEGKATQFSLAAGTHHLPITGEDLPPGLYSCEIITLNGRTNLKFVKTR